MAKKKKVARRPARKSTALVPARRQSSVTILPPVTEKTYTVAADGSLQLGALGLVECKLTDKEEAVLAERVNPDDVKWRASRKNGPKDVPYLSHPTYTKWFNRAFGRTGWSLVPVGKPMKTEQSVVLIPYVLHVHGIPVAFAWGEQEYFDRKADGSESRAQSYGDVIESTVASALRRCAKHLGVGLELWDKDWTSALKGGSQPEPERFYVAPEQSQRRQRQERKTERPPAPVEHVDMDEKITDDQRLRLWNISRRVGRGDSEVQDWLKRRFKVKTSSDITRRDYDQVVRAIEQRGPLPEGD